MHTSMSTPFFRPRSTHHQRGSLTVLMVFVLTAVAAFCMYAINTAYMEMAVMDLQTVTDLSAKAGAQELGRTQDYARSREALERHVRLHQASRGSSIQFLSANYGGINVNAGTGRIQFDPTKAPGPLTSAVQARGRYPELFTGSLVPFPLFGNRSFSIETVSTAARTDADLVLCIDRSASMAWDLSNVPFQYPNGTKGLDNYFRPPMPGSRWNAVIASVDTLVDTIQRNRVSGEVHVGLVTFASPYQFGVFRSTRSNIDVNLTRNNQDVVNALRLIGENPIIGDTNIDAGLSLVDLCRRQGAMRTITGHPILVLLTDGIYTEGGSPVDRAVSLANLGWKIHTISFSAQADRVLMKQIADIGSGNHYHAPNQQALLRAFQDIASNLPGTLIQ